MTTRPANLAAQKIRNWRNSQSPRMSGGEFARRFKIGPATVYRIETGRRIPSAAVLLKLQAAGICELEDFKRPAVVELDDAEEAAGT